MPRTVYLKLQIKFCLVVVLDYVLFFHIALFFYNALFFSTVIFSESSFHFYCPFLQEQSFESSLTKTESNQLLWSAFTNARTDEQSGGSSSTNQDSSREPDVDYEQLLRFDR